MTLLADRTTLDHADRAEKRENDLKDRYLSIVYDEMLQLSAEDRMFIYVQLEKESHARRRAFYLENKRNNHTIQYVDEDLDRYLNDGGYPTMKKHMDEFLSRTNEEQAHHIASDKSHGMGLDDYHQWTTGVYDGTISPLAKV